MKNDEQTFVQRIEKQEEIARKQDGKVMQQKNTAGPIMVSTTPYVDEEDPGDNTSAQLRLLLLGVGVMVSLAGLSVRSIVSSNAASIPVQTWEQSNWSGGVGPSTQKQYESAVGLKTEAAGIQLGNTSNWMNHDWLYRRPVTINNAESTTHDVQVRIAIGYAEGMQDNFRDVRFADEQGNQLPFWIESYSKNKEAIFWVNTKELRAGENTYYLYYGNENAGWESNGDATFLFYDDFENFSGWQTVGAGKLKGTTTKKFEGSRSAEKTGTDANGGAVKSLGQTLGNGIAIDFEMYRNANEHSAEKSDKKSGITEVERIGVVNSAGEGYGWALDQTNGQIEVERIKKTTTGTEEATAALKSVSQKWIHGSLQIQDDGTITAEHEYKGSVKSVTAQSAASQSLSKIYIAGVEDYYIDALRARTLLAHEPSITIGTEESVKSNIGTLTSSIFDSKLESGATWNSIAFTTTNEQQTEVRVRTSNSPTMDGAPAFATCLPLAPNASLQKSACVSSGHRYAQYEVILRGTGESPVLSNISIVYQEALAPAPNTPAVISPGEGAVVESTVQLRGTTYDGIGATHISTTWQIDDDADFSTPEWSRTAEDSEIEVVVNTNNGVFAGSANGQTSLQGGKTYYARVRYGNSQGTLSDFSSPIVFEMAGSEVTPEVTPTPTPTPIASATPTPTPIEATITPSATPAVTVTPTPTATPTPTPSVTPVVLPVTNLESTIQEPDQVSIVDESATSTSPTSTTNQSPTATPVEEQTSAASETAALANGQGSEPHESTGEESTSLALASTTTVAGESNNAADRAEQTAIALLDREDGGLVSTRLEGELKSEQQRRREKTMRFALLGAVLVLLVWVTPMSVAIIRGKRRTAKRKKEQQLQRQKNLAAMKKNQGNKRAKTQTKNKTTVKKRTSTKKSATKK